MKIVLRLLSAVALTILLFAVLLSIGIFFLIADGRNMASLLPILLIPMTLVLTPSIFAACLISDPPKTARLLAALKAMGIVAPLYLVWQLNVGPWIGRTFLAGTSAAIEHALMLDSSIGIIITFGSIILTARFLSHSPSVKLGPAPSAIKRFEILVYISLVLLLANSMLAYEYSSELHGSMDFSYSSSPQFVRSIVVSTAIFSALFTIYLTRKVARDGSKNIRDVMFGLFIIGIVLMIPGLAVWADVQPLVVVIAAVSFIIQGIALRFAYSREAESWLVGGSVTPVQHGLG